MKSVVRVTTVMVGKRAVYQLERVASGRANRSFALNSKRPELTEPCRLRRVFEALRGDA